MPRHWRPTRLLNGHLGASVSALVDGQLDEESAERAWDHVMHCPPCRRLVEHEGWVKRQLAMMAGPRAEDPPDQLVGSLLDLDPAADAWADVDEIEERGRGRRRAGIVLVGAGSVSAAVLGLTALGGASLSVGGSGTPASINGSAPSSSPTRASVAPSVAVHGRLDGWTVRGRDHGVAHARAVDAPR
jgi:predicted anti-sigma-YlaC factor YlaD